MNLLLDTHIFLWLNQNPSQMPKHLLDLCAEPQNTLFLSLVSPWEIQIKQQLGKLKLQVSLGEMISRQPIDNDLQILPITLTHIEALANLEAHHHDPFDRLLIAQAKTEAMLLVTVDRKIRDYSVMTAF
jgi:PIN domain nuclease of toxin-antitoxin system